MFWLLDFDGLTKKEPIKNLLSATLEETLATGEKKLDFEIPTKYASNILEERYILTESNKFVIKAISRNLEITTISCLIDVEQLENNIFESFIFKDNLSILLGKLTENTVWTFINHSKIKIRNIEINDFKNAFEIIQELICLFLVEIEFDSISKKIIIYDQMGSDKNFFFIDSLNLRELEIQTDSYELYTRIIPIGKNNLRLPENHIDNFQYISKIKTMTWKKDSYEDVDSLREDATILLKGISKPCRAISANVINIYGDSKCGLGDTITIHNKKMKSKEKQRIVKYTHDLVNKFEDVVELSFVKANLIDYVKGKK